MNNHRKFMSLYNLTTIHLNH